ncbi:MAG: hypothetical protein HYX63_16670 [Gammaproteobacteria bacterium]|nr:hypothetical protein [Gammaproteobacteria bacterium]
MAFATGVRVAAATDDRAAFDSTGLDAVFKAFGASGAKRSSDIAVSAPEIAENGTVVPIEVESKLPGIRSIAIVIKKSASTLGGVRHSERD